MSSTILQVQYGAQARPLAVAQAWRDLSTAAYRLVVAVRAALPSRHVPLAAPPTPLEAAARVRHMATKFLATDPGFAADLYAAADRHEREHGL